MYIQINFQHMTLQRYLEDGESISLMLLLDFYWQMGNNMAT